MNGGYTMKKARFLSLLLVIMLMLTAMPALAVNEVSGELTVWIRGDESFNGIWGNEPGDPFYDYIKEQFPNLKIDYIVNKGWTELDAAAAAGDAPDIFFWEDDPSTGVKKLLERGLCENLTPYIEKDASFVNNFVPALMDAHSIDGQLYGIPFDVMPYGIFVNYDVLDKANVDYPSLDWTLDEFVEMCQKVTNKSDPYNTTIAIARNVIENDYVRFMNMFFAAYGVKTYGVREDGTKYSNLSEDPAAITAIEKYMELQANNYAYTLSADERNAIGLDNSIWDIDWEAGVAATFPGVSSWAFLVDGNGDPLFNQVFYPAFIGPEGSGATLNTISYSMYAGSNNKDAAWEFLKTFTSKEFREGAYAVDEATGATVYPHRYDQDKNSFGWGLPPFDAEYDLNEDYAKLFNGLSAAMSAPFTSYVSQFDLLEATRKVARGEMQLVDALKEYDEYVNANGLIVY